MRLFVAVNFNNDTRSQLQILCDELRRKSEHGRFTVPKNMHLTLAFLGECDAEQTSHIKAVMDGASFESFDLVIDCVGRFRRNGRELWWAGVKENAELLKLQQRLTDDLISAGFRLDKRKYSPHITLGREIKTDATAKSIDPFGETVTRIDLMKSEHVNGKLIYSIVHSAFNTS